MMRGVWIWYCCQQFVAGKDFIQKDTTYQILWRKGPNFGTQAAREPLHSVSYVKVQVLVLPDLQYLPTAWHGK